MGSEKNRPSTESVKNVTQQRRTLEKPNLSNSSRHARLNFVRGCLNFFFMHCLLFSAVNSNRYVPKNLCSEFSLNGFTPLGSVSYYDASVESRDSIKARFKNLDITGNPIETTGQSISRDTDKFNTFSNQDSFVENEPR